MGFKSLRFDGFDSSLPEEDLMINDINNRDVAIIGLSFMLPDALDMVTFASNLKNRHHSMNDFPKERRGDIINYLNYKNNDKQSDYSFTKGSYLKEIDKFDYKFFKMTPKEASLMNPLQRLFLETCWNAIEDGGYGGKRIASSNTGVYLGMISDLEGYQYKEMLLNIESEANLKMSMSGNLSSIIPSRISYILDLKGPSMLIDTACSSSLVSLHVACQALRNNECEMAIAGGARVSLFPLVSNIAIGMESSDGFAKSFDDSSDGTGVGEGIVALLLKPLHKAREDKDNIYAVIKGSAVNQDGTSMGITAPNARAQTEVMIKAWNDAGINPETISYIEAHGTGTKLGDPIEADGIEKAFRKFTDKRQFCAVSSLKTNIGHLYETAGLAGIIKTIASLKNNELYPSLHFNKPNRRINFEDSPIYINDRLSKWEMEGEPRRCGVSSFGFSGTNCHVVLEEAPAYSEIQDKEEIPVHIFTLSAKSHDALTKLVQRYLDNLKNDQSRELLDVCYTANTGRDCHNIRFALIVESQSDLINKLEQIVEQGLISQHENDIFFSVHKLISTDKGNKKEDERSEEDIRELTRTCNEIVEGIQYMTIEQLRGIAAYYIQGAEIYWSDLYREVHPKKVSLPVYPFDRTRCWLDVPKNETVDAKGLYYGIKWNECRLPDSLTRLTFNSEEVTLVIRDESGFGMELANEIRVLGGKVIEVDITNHFKMYGPEIYGIGDREQDYVLLLNAIGEEKITNIIHSSSLSQRQVENEAELEKAQKKGLYSLFYLVKGIGQTNKNIINIFVVSDYINEVDRNERIIKQENAPLFGLAKVIRTEYSNINIRCMDIDRIVEPTQVLAEFENGRDTFMSTYRQGRRFIAELGIIDINTVSATPIEIKEHGIYVITGGTGGIGLEIAMSMAKKTKMNIALINRSKMPDASQWDDILKIGIDKKLCETIKAIKEMERNGSQVICISVDVSSSNGLRAEIEALRKTYGRINGIIHSAGIAGAGFIFNKQEKTLDEVLSPKVYGAWNLYQHTKIDKPDFFVSFSSGISLLGMPGMGDYTAANAYLDSFSSYLRNEGCRAITINWVAWQEVGMAVTHGFTGGSRLFKDISTLDAINAFYNVLNSNLTNVLIGEIEGSITTVGLEKKIPFKLSLEIIKSIEGMGRSQRVNEQQVKKLEQLTQVKLSGRDNNEYSETEKKIAHICKDVLGFEEINIDDSFLEIGADSIALARIHERIDEIYPNRLTVSQIFVYPTILKIAKFLNEDVIDTTISKAMRNEEIKVQNRVDKNELEQLLESVESQKLSVDDAIDLLSKL